MAQMLPISNEMTTAKFWSPADICWNFSGFFLMRRKTSCAALRARPRRYCTQHRTKITFDYLTLFVIIFQAALYLAAPALGAEVYSKPAESAAPKIAINATVRLGNFQAEISVCNGGMSKIFIDRNWPAAGISLYSAGGDLNIFPLALKKDGSVTGSTATFRKTPIGKPLQLKVGANDLTIKLNSVSEDQKLWEKAGCNQDQSDGQSNCCVACGKITMCAGNVKAACGSCWFE